MPDGYDAYQVMRRPDVIVVPDSIEEVSRIASLATRPRSHHDSWSGSFRKLMAVLGPVIAPGLARAGPGAQHRRDRARNIETKFLSPTPLFYRSLGHLIVH